ncbi:tat pathway signal sequence [Seiridium cupressi]
MQMKLDGRFSNISFICSQTDNIMVNDAVDSLGLQGEHDQLVSTMDSFTKRRPEMEAEMGRLDILCKEQEERFDILEKTLKTWDNLSAKNAAGKRVFAPASTSGKRKPTAPKTNVAKKRRKAQRSSLLPESDIEEEEEEEEAGESSGNAPPLTTEQINDKVSQLKEEKKKTQQKHHELEVKLDNIQDHLESLQHEYEKSQQHFVALCIMKRNEYSREAIQNQFAYGIQILDQEIAMKEDGDNFNPDVHARDYESIARSLEVFCVSSRAYKALGGTPKEKEDMSRAGFINLEQTEIPQLIAYAKKLTNDSRVANYRKFMNTCLQIFESLVIWLGVKNKEIALPQDKAEILARKTTEVLLVLRKDLEAAARKSADDCMEVFKKEIFRSFASAGMKAANKVPAIAEQWGAPQQKDGYHYGTYKAVYVRRGAYSSPKYGRIDFNEKLCYPFMEEVAASWEKAFTRDIPRILEDFHLTSQRLMNASPDSIQNHLQHPGASERIRMLRPQLTTYVQTIKDGQSDFGHKVQEWQRESSRELAPAIKPSLKDVYAECKTISGPGSFTQMKHVIEKGVKENARKMYTKSSKTTTDKLRTMCSDYGAILDEQVGNTIDNMTSDYIGTISKQTVNAAPEDVRRNTVEILQSFN